MRIIRISESGKRKKIPGGSGREGEGKGIVTRAIAARRAGIIIVTPMVFHCIMDAIIIKNRVTVGACVAECLYAFPLISGLA